MIKFNQAFNKARAFCLNHARPIIAMGAICIVSVCLAFTVLFYYVNQPLALSPQGVDYQLKRGVYAHAVLKDFHKRNWIDDKVFAALRFYVRIFGIGSDLKAGEYRFQPNLGARSALLLMSTGRSELRQLTLVEGWTFNKSLAFLQDIGLTIDWRSEDELKTKLRLSQYPNMEGLIFPDTYFYHRDLRASDVLRTASKRLFKVLEEEWRDRVFDLPYEHPYQALIVASIIEKEARLKSEQPRIAGVLLRRWQRNIRLAADPTVIYGIGEDNFDGNIRRRHLRDASNPYNTYMHKGLPPTPIALIGRSALHAALHPTNENTLYFVARGDGSHIFSETLEEHERWVDRYQR